MAHSTCTSSSSYFSRGFDPDPYSNLHAFMYLFKKLHIFLDPTLTNTSSPFSIITCSYSYTHLLPKVSQWVFGLGLQSGNFSGYTANNYLRSTFDLAVKFNSSWRSRTSEPARRLPNVWFACNHSFRPVDLRIQN